MNCIIDTAGASGRTNEQTIVDALRECIAECIADTGRKIMGDRAIDATGWAEAAFDPNEPKMHVWCNGQWLHGPVDWMMGCKARGAEVRYL